MIIFSGGRLGGAVAGIVIGSLVLIGFVIFGACCIVKRLTKSKSSPSSGSNFKGEYSAPEPSAVYYKN